MEEDSETADEGIFCVCVFFFFVIKLTGLLMTYKTMLLYKRADYVYHV